jgi:hypothetical protein
MLEQLSEQLDTQAHQPAPLYSQLALVLVLGAVLTGWIVYGKVSTRIDQLTQKPVLAMEQTIQPKL